MRVAMSSTPPVIGICAVKERARWAFWDQAAHLAADTYVSAVQDTGALAVMLPVDTRAPEALLDRIDGLMVIGGADLDPAIYGQERSRPPRHYRDRESRDGAPRAAIDRGLPYMDLLRGSVLNVEWAGP